MKTPRSLALIALIALASACDDGGGNGITDPKPPTPPTPEVPIEQSNGLSVEGVTQLDGGAVKITDFSTCGDQAIMMADKIAIIRRDGKVITHPHAASLPKAVVITCDFIYYPIDGQSVQLTNHDFNLGAGSTVLRGVPNTGTIVGLFELVNDQLLGLDSNGNGVIWNLKTFTATHSGNFRQMFAGFTGYRKWTDGGSLKGYIVLKGNRAELYNVQWNLMGRFGSQFSNPNGHQYTDASVCPGGKRIIIGRGNEAEVHILNSGNMEDFDASLPALRAVTAVLCIAENRVILGTGDGQHQLWDTTRERVNGLLTLHNSGKKVEGYTLRGTDFSAVEGGQIVRYKINVK